MADSDRPILAVTMGDPSGIGPEICLKAVAALAGRPSPLVVFGDAAVLRMAAERGGMTMPPTASELPAALALADRHGGAVLDLPGLPTGWQPGAVDAHTGAAAFRYITVAIDAALTGRVRAVVTAPIHKKSLRAAGVSYPGHTEIFESLTSSRRACMMLTSDELTCTFVTTHVGLCEVPELLSIQRVLDVIELTDRAITKIHRRRPRLAVLGLNPHAGEHGLFGRGEEERVILPAIETARAAGLLVEGPLPPDTAFLPRRRRQTDGFVCMYHDQGHIPLKALSFETAVNTTLGLPIVRTSVDHGTALDIAWNKFNADETSMLQAIRLATSLACDETDKSVADDKSTANVADTDSRR